MYYKSYEDDLVTSKNQNLKLKENYKWIHHNLFYNILSYLIYYIFLVVAILYTKLFLHVKIKNKKALKGYKGYYVYGNHTQELGDVLSPLLYTFPTRPYAVCSPANLGIPLLGKILPLLGALPIPDSISKLKIFKDAISQRIHMGKCVVIYPEAHLWPYYTNIREFPNTSFHFPVDDNAIIFCATTTYAKRKLGRKPKITIYIDGPFGVDEKLSRKENINMLHDKVYDIMLERSASSNYKYIDYKKIDK